MTVAVGVSLLVTGFYALVVSICTYDEQKRRGVMFEGPVWALGVVGTRNNTHAYILYDSNTYKEYLKAGWVCTGVVHTTIGWEQKIYAHLVLPTKVDNGGGA